MAIAATFFKNNKVHNSTAIPPTVPEMRKDYAIELKSPTSILSPVITIKPDSLTDTPFDYNYCYIATFHRFYWVNNWAWNNGLWTAALAVDVLTSYRDMIGSSSQYVERSSAARNGAVVDAMYPTLATNTIDYMDIQWGWERPGGTGGFYIVGIINDDLYNIGTISYYAMTAAGLKAFAEYLITEFADWTQIPAEEISENLQKTLINPTDYISTVKWVPYKLSNLISAGAVTHQTYLKFGYWRVPREVTGVYHFNNLTIYQNITGISIKKHPLAATRGEYLNTDPYTSYILHFPPFGEIPLDSTMMIGATSLSMEVDLDITTTSAVLTVYSNRGRMETSEIMKARTVLGVDIRLDKLGYDVNNQNFGYFAIGAGALAAINKAADVSRPVTNAVDDFMQNSEIGQGLTNFMQEHPIISGVVGAYATTSAGGVGSLLSTLRGSEYLVDNTNFVGEASKIVSALGTAATSLHSAGAFGSFAEYARTSVFIQCVFANIAPNSNARLGSPLCEIRRIDQIPGYIQVSNPLLNSTGYSTPAEIENIKNHMSAGFFYE